VKKYQMRTAAWWGAQNSGWVPPHDARSKAPCKLFPEMMTRYWGRRLGQHIVILLCACLCTIVAWVLFRDRQDLISHFSIALAYPALFLTAAALLLGPLNVLRKRPNPVSFDLRRDLGIWAGILAVIHTVIGLNVHLRGRPWLYFVNEHHRIRLDVFGFANDTGTIAALIFLLLLALSNDLSVRKLGTRKWKSLQRWTYVAVILTFLHAVAYQSIEKRTVVYEASIWTMCGLVSGIQLGGWRIMRSRG
jgi:sulfoxide reductase heme-binding subunit YedZ